jgi:hypothetical protein
MSVPPPNGDRKRNIKGFLAAAIAKRKNYKK